MTLEDISGGETSHIQETKLESKAVDLVLGKEDNIEKMLKMATAESDMSVSDCSENGDPVYDESLLADLFYTAKKVSILIHVILAGTFTGVQGDIRCKVLAALSTVRYLLVT